MPKPVALTPALLETVQPPPQAATSARVAKPPQVKKDLIPLQLNLPREEVRAIKVAAAQQGKTLSDFMLACFHGSMKT